MGRDDSTRGGRVLEEGREEDIEQIKGASKAGSKYSRVGVVREARGE